MLLFLMLLLTQQDGDGKSSKKKFGIGGLKQNPPANIKRVMSPICAVRVCSLAMPANLAPCMQT